MSDFEFTTILAVFFIVSAFLVWLLGGVDDISEQDPLTERIPPAPRLQEAVAAKPPVEIAKTAPVEKAAQPAAPITVPVTAPVTAAVAPPAPQTFAEEPPKPRSIADELVDIAFEPASFELVTDLTPAAAMPPPAPSAIKMLNPTFEQRLAAFEKPSVAATLPPGRPHTLEAMPRSIAQTTAAAFIAPSVAATLPPRTATDDAPAKEEALAEPEPDPAPHPALALDADMEALLDSLDDPDAMAKLKDGASPELSVIAASLSNKLVIDDETDEGAVQPAATATDDRTAQPEPAPHPALALDRDMEALLDSLDDPDAMAKLKDGASPELSVIAASLSNKLVFDDADDDGGDNDDDDAEPIRSTSDGNDGIDADDRGDGEPAFLLSTARRGTRMIGAQADTLDFLDLEPAAAPRPQASTIWSRSYLRPSVGHTVAGGIEVLQMTPGVRAERIPVRAETILVGKPKDGFESASPQQAAQSPGRADVTFTLPPGALGND